VSTAAIREHSYVRGVRLACVDSDRKADDAGVAVVNVAVATTNKLTTSPSVGSSLMSLDIVDLVLERWMDWGRFETLAGEIMRDEGYPDIKPLGGWKDAGQDAVVERFFESSGRHHRIVFQFSLQSDVGRKLRDTIDTLHKNDIEFQKLVIVTTTPLDAEPQATLRRTSRKEYDVDLEIYERKTIANRLADPNAGLLQRFFPNLREQIETLEAKRGSSLKDESLREQELLKVCQAFTFSRGAARTRKSMIDAAVLSLLTSERTALPELFERGAEVFGAALLQSDQIKAALIRLEKAGQAQRRVDRWSITQNATVQLEGVSATSSAAEQAVVADLINAVTLACDEEPSAQIKAVLERNARAVLAGYFRTNGLELANCFFENSSPSLVYAESTPQLRVLAAQGVPAHWGEALATSIAEALVAPTDEQARYFAACSRSYIALCVMNCDPALREFQETRFQTKVFALDTDFVLHAVIEDLPLSVPYRSLVVKLSELRARVVVPEEVLQEMATHFEIAPRTYDYFGVGFAGLSQELADARVRNTLVRGYWYWSEKRNEIPSRNGFLEYRRNYIDESNPLGFLGDVLRAKLPSVEIAPLEQVFPAPGTSEVLAPTIEAFIETAKEAKGGADRTDEQEASLARLDGELLLGIDLFNADTSRARSALGRRAYLLTSSGRFARVARRLGRESRVAARPHLVMALLELTSPRIVDDAQFVSLFENSLLQEIVDRCWRDIQPLLSVGLQLRNKSITRLRQDVETRLHDLITDLEQADVEDAQTDVSKLPPEFTAEAQYFDFLQEAHKFGYRPAGLLGELFVSKAVNQERVEQVLRENEELKARIDRIGRKQKRWLRRQGNVGRT